MKTRTFIKFVDEMSNDELKEELLTLREELHCKRMIRRQLEGERINSLAALSAAFLVLLLLILLA